MCLGFVLVNQFAFGAPEFELDAQKFEIEDYYCLGSKCTEEYLLDLKIPPFNWATLLEDYT